MENRRGSHRARVLKSGKIIVSDKAPKIDCTVRDLSDTGARLIFPSTTFGLPREFKLVIGEGSPRSCRVAWRTEKELGVNFE